MRLRVDETEYDITESLQGAAIGDLLELKVKTKTPEFTGVTVKHIQGAFSAVGEKLSEGDFDTIDLLGDEDFLHAMFGLIFLARRRAGEKVTVDEAKSVKFADFQIIPDEGEEEAAEELPKESVVGDVPAP